MKTTDGKIILGVIVVLVAIFTAIPAQNADAKGADIFMAAEVAAGSPLGRPVHVATLRRRPGQPQLRQAMFGYWYRCLD